MVDSQIEQRRKRCRKHQERVHVAEQPFHFDSGRGQHEGDL